jgi:hypothetical protein
MDEAILREAKRQGLEVLALEEWDEQLTTVDESFDVSQLEALIAERQEFACLIDQRLAAYRVGDLDAVVGPMDVIAADELLAKRNHAWLSKLEDIARQKKGAFVAVGVSHMIGPTVCQRSSWRKAIAYGAFEYDGGARGAPARHADGARRFHAVAHVAPPAARAGGCDVDPELRLGVIAVGLA